MKEETLSFNPNYANNSYSNKDVLSAFKETSEKSLSIHQGMSVKEISEIVSEKIITVVKEQFEATKIHYETKEMKQTAVEWLYDRFLFAGYAVNPEWKEQAKEMEKMYYTEFEVLQLLLKLQQTESYDNLYDWFQENKKTNF